MKESTNLFSHELLADNIAKVFNEYNKNNSFVIAINGPWGTGKTHLMEGVLGLLEEHEYIKVNFNAWRFSQKEEIWRALLVSIIDACKKYVEDDSNIKSLGWNEDDVDIVMQLIDDTERALYTAFIKEVPGEISVDTSSLLKAGINVALKFVPWGEFGSEFISDLLVKKDENGKVVNSTVEMEDVEKIWGIFKKSSTKRTIEKTIGVEQFRKSFEMLINAILQGNYSDEVKKNKLTQHNKKIKLIVAIDDLDRCLPECALETLEAIKLFVDFPSTYFILAMDSMIIQQGLDIRYEKIEYAKIRAKDYYEKIIDLSFNIPALCKESFCRYIKTLSHFEAEYIKMFDVLYIALKSNLRSWQRYIYRADFNRNIIKQIGGDDILDKEEMWRVFLKLQCFSYQWPELYRLIYDSDTYLKLEKSVSKISDYDMKNMDNIIGELEKYSISKEVRESLLDKNCVDFIRTAPHLGEVSNNEYHKLFFTYDKVSLE